MPIRLQNVISRQDVTAGRAGWNVVGHLARGLSGMDEMFAFRIRTHPPNSHDCRFADIDHLGRVMTINTTQS